MEKENQRLLLEGANSFGIHLDEKAIGAFDLYLKELLKWNRKINLTAIRSEKGIVVKHFIDSLSIYPHLAAAFSLLDIGSGAGFPGIPLKMVKPDLNVTLIDSVRKKVDFQRHIIRTLGLKGIEATHGRAEEEGLSQGMEGRFDTVISRAFSDLKTLLILSSPFLKKGGRVLAMKGETEEEVRVLDQSEGTPFKLRNSLHFLLPSSSFKRSILLFEKE
jgi:16S rRNA (guanine527-N7)-methyltransferase